MEIPDFRKKADRDRYRHDDWQQPRYDTKRGVFGGAELTETASRFSSIMKDMVIYAPAYRAYIDWKKVQSAMAQPEQLLPIAQRLLDVYPKLTAAYRDALILVKEYPKSDGAQVLREMLEVGEADRALAPAFLPALRREVAALKRKFGGEAAPLTRFAATPIMAGPARIAETAYPAASLKFKPLPYEPNWKFIDIRGLYQGLKDKNGLIYARGGHTAPKAGPGRLRVAADGPFKVFVNRKAVGCDPRATNPINDHTITIDVAWKKGPNEIVIAQRTNGGMAWGFSVIPLVTESSKK